MKKILSLLLVCCLCLSLFACSKTETAGQNVANPMTEETAASLLEAMGLDLSYMESYENARFFKYATEPVIAEVQFSFEGREYSYRVAPVAAETDISGMNYQNAETTDEMVSYNSATLRTGEGMGDISWFDAAPGVQYNLSCGKDADGAALIALANELFVPTQGDVGGVGVANPMTEETAVSLLEATGIDLSFMESYENAHFFKYATEPVIAEVQFSYEGRDYRYRVAPVGAETDISGIYYQNAETTDEAVSYNSARLTVGDGMGNICWFDVVPGIQYDLSCSENADGAALIALANKLFVPAQGDVGGENDGFMQDTLADFQQGYHPGSAGCSLTGASYAAALADLFTEVQPSAETVGQEIYRFGSTLSVEDQVTFAAQLMGLQGSFENLAQNGIAILEDAGTTAAHYPWDNGTISTLFSAMTLYGSEYAYAQRIRDYANAINDGKSWEELTEAGLNYMAHDLTLDTLGYAFEDLDNDGLKELILGAIAEDDYLKGLVLELDTVDSFGACTQVFMSGERDRLYTVSGNHFNHEGSSGADDSFEALEEYSEGELKQIGTELGEVTPLFLLPLTYMAD